MNEQHKPLSYPSDPRHCTADECQSMPEVRYEIDRLDRVLVEIIAERVTYMTAAARIKSSRDKVHDQARIEDVVSKVIASAEKNGLPREIAEPVWREMINRCIAYEFDRWDEMKGVKE